MKKTCKTDRIPRSGVLMLGFVACLSDDDDTPKTVAVTGVSVSPESVSGETGDVVTLTATASNGVKASTEITVKAASVTNPPSVDTDPLSASFFVETSTENVDTEGTVADTDLYTITTEAALENTTLSSNAPTADTSKGETTFATGRRTSLSKCMPCLRTTVLKATNPIPFTTPLHQKQTLFNIEQNSLYIKQDSFNTKQTLLHVKQAPPPHPPSSTSCRAETLSAMWSAPAVSSSARSP